MITVRSKYVLKIILSLVVFFVFLNVIVYFLVRYNVFSEKYLLIVNLDTERNLPTFFATLLLLLASVILWMIAAKEKQKFYWYFLSGMFLFLALDENIGIHESFGALVSSVSNTKTHGVFYFTWIIPYGIALFGLAIFLYRFVWSLPKRTKILFLTSGLIFISGALGLEMISGIYAEDLGVSSSIFRLLTFIEEILEMTGVSLFIFALLDYIEGNFGGLTISLGKQK